LGIGGPADTTADSDAAALERVGWDTSCVPNYASKVLQIQQVAAVTTEVAWAGAGAKTPTLRQYIDMIDIFALLSSRYIPVCISGRIPDFAARLRAERYGA